MIKTRLTLLTLTGAMLFTACSTSKPEHYKAYDASADVGTEFSSLEDLLNGSRAKHVDILAPKQFTQAQKNRDQAERDRAANKESDKILDSIAKAKAFLHKANQIADETRASVANILAARHKAISASAPNAKPKEWADLEGDFRDYTEDSSNGKVPMSDATKSAFQNRYRGLEVDSIVIGYLGKARNVLDVGKKEGAEKRAPQAWLKANEKYQETEGVAMNDSYNTAKLKLLAREALHEAEQMVGYVRIAKATEGMSDEERAVYISRKDAEITAAKGANAALTADGARQAAKLNSQYAKLTALEKQALVDQKIATIRKDLNAGEADVFKEGDNVLIRLKTINFPKNQAALRPSQLAVLSKVQNAVQTLTPTRVVVEGHTDSTGTAALNKTLSEERAQVVESFLVNSGTVQSANIESVGMGFDKPLAPNKSAKGRATNRRIDVILEL